jgi:hypothetical protein
MSARREVYVTSQSALLFLVKANRSVRMQQPCDLLLIQELQIVKNSLRRVFRAVECNLMFTYEGSMRV